MVCVYRVLYWRTVGEIMKEFTDQCFLAILMAIMIAGMLYVFEHRDRLPVIAPESHSVPWATGTNPD